MKANKNIYFEKNKSRYEKADNCSLNALNAAQVKTKNYPHLQKSNKELFSKLLTPN